MSDTTPTVDLDAVQPPTVRSTRMRQINAATWNNRRTRDVLIMRCVRCRQPMPDGDVGLFCPGCR